MQKTEREVNYQTLGVISHMISSATDMADVCQHVVTQLCDALKLKGCAIMLLDRKTNKLELAAAHGLSQEYLEKGPVNAAKSIAGSISEGPVAIYNASEDPRCQYPGEASEEGIHSILSVPLILRGNPMGVMRLYTSDPWEFSMQDITFVTAIAELVALVLDNLRVTNALKTSIQTLKVLRPVIKPSKRTLYE